MTENDYFLQRLNGAAGKKKLKHHRVINGASIPPDKWQKALREAIRKRVVKVHSIKDIVENAVLCKGFIVFERESYDAFSKKWNEDTAAARKREVDEAYSKIDAIDEEVQRVSDLVVLGKSSDLGDLLREFMAKQF